MGRGPTASFLLTYSRPSLRHSSFFASILYLSTIRSSSSFRRAALSTMTPISPNQAGRRPNMIDLTQSPAQSRSEDEDEVNLKKAIALSLQLTKDEAHATNMPHVLDSPSSDLPSTKEPQLKPEQRTFSSPEKVAVVKAEPVMVGVLGLDRKQMEAERLARLKRKRTEDISPPPVTRRVRSPAPKIGLLQHVPIVADSTYVSPVVSSTMPPLKYSKPTLLKTWSASHSRSSRPPLDIKLAELLSPATLQSAVLSSYIWDYDWLFLQFGAHLKRVKLLLVMHAKFQNQKGMIQHDFLGISNVKLCFPNMEGQINCMHSKLMLLFFDGFMRLVVPTANLIPIDWGEEGIMENTVFVVDLPVQADVLQDNSAEAVPISFLSSLMQYIKAQGMPPDVRRKVAQHDFSALDNVRFVHTIGGPHKDPEWRCTGISGLGRAIKSLGLRLPKLDEAMDLQLDFITSSLGSLNPDFLRSIYLGAAGDDGLTDVGLRSKSSTERQATLTRRTSGTPWLANFRIYFPSSATVHSSRGGPTRAGTICFQPKWWSSPTFPKQNMRDCVSTREGLLMHSKIMYVSFPQPITGHTGAKTSGWIYVGSANLSESAWGRLVLDRSSKQPRLNCRNWECGIVMPVPTDGSEEGLDIFKSVLPTPMVVPAESYNDGRLPWYFMAEGDE